jgi:hypothetical protein
VIDAALLDKSYHLSSSFNSSTTCTMAMSMKISKAAASSLQARASRASSKTQQRRTAVVVRADKKFSDQEWDQAMKKASGVADDSAPAPTPVATVKAVSFGGASIAALITQSFTDLPSMSSQMQWPFPDLYQRPSTAGWPCLGS